MSVQAPSLPDLRSQVHDAARRARVAARTLATLSTETKNRALHAAADAVLARVHEILAANEQDLEAARAAGTPTAMLDRLALNPQRVDGIAAGLRQVAGLPDPIGEVLRGRTLPNGLQLRQQRVPLGVVGIVYEGRPNVTVDAFGLTLKSGNAVLLRGSSSAAQSNAALVTALRDALVRRDCPMPSTASQRRPRQRDPPDPGARPCRRRDPARGSGPDRRCGARRDGPTIETGVGNCHVYVHYAADLDVAERILLNAKTRRPSVCNAAESLPRSSYSADLPSLACGSSGATATPCGSSPRPGRENRADRSAPGARRSTRPSSTSLITAVAVMVLEIDAIVNNVSAVTGSGSSRLVTPKPRSVC